MDGGRALQCSPALTTGVAGVELSVCWTVQLSTGLLVESCINSAKQSLKSHQASAAKQAQHRSQSKHGSVQTRSQASVVPKFQPSKQAKRPTRLLTMAPSHAGAQSFQQST